MRLARRNRFLFGTHNQRQRPYSNRLVQRLSPDKRLQLMVPVAAAESIPKIRLLSGEVECDRWLTPGEADRLLAVCPPHLSALVRFALATGCRARETTGLEWERSI